ncbi:hypothetical protein Gotur_018110 [Gossypium turneri]
MEKRFLGKVEDNAAVRTWSEMAKCEKGDILAEGYVSKLWDFTRISVTQNSLQAPILGSRPVLESYLQLLHIWESRFVPTIEEYMALLWCLKIQVDRAYSRAVNVLTFLKKLMNIIGISKQWVAAQIKQKRDSKCIPWESLKDLILAHPNTKKGMDVFALSIYGLVVFLKALGHIDEAVIDLFDRLDKRVTPVPAILAETFRSLNACRKAGEGRFIGCVQLLLAWFHSHFWKVDRVSHRVFFENYSPLKEIIAAPRRDDILEEKWMAILQNLQEEVIEWRAP